MGLIGGIARTAVAAGTWTAVSNTVSRRQAGRWAAQDQSNQTPEYVPPPPGRYRRPMFQPPPPAPHAPYAQPVSAYPPPYGPPPPEAGPPPPRSPAPVSDPMAVRLEHLRQLGELKAQGVLTEAEFEAQKRRVLGA